MTIRDDVLRKVVDLEDISELDVNAILRPAALAAGEMEDAIRPELIINEAFPGLVRGEMTAVLYDCNNLYKRARSLDFQIDYEKLHMLLANRCDLRYSGAFSAIDPTSASERIWVENMRSYGYDVKTKPIRKFRNDDKIIVKGNMDNELTVAAMQLSDAFTHVIIATCDGDFEEVIRALRANQARKVSVMGMPNGKFKSITDSLIQVSSHFYDLSKIKDYISIKKVS